MASRMPALSLALMLTLLGGSLARGQQASSNGAESQPAGTTPGASMQKPSLPATPPAGDKPSAEADAVLWLLERRGEEIKSLSCKLTYVNITIDPVRSEKKKFGELLFDRKKEQTRFFVRFDRKVASSVVDRNQEFYLFDGRWLIERNDKAKTVIRREIVQAGESYDPFKLGEGPFPLPFGQKRDDMLAAFTVTLQPPQADDPPKSDRLHCMPRPRTELSRKYHHIDFVVDRKTSLPVRIVLQRSSDDNVIEAWFEEISTNVEIKPGVFEIHVPEGFSERTETGAGGSDADISIDQGD